MTVAVPPAVEVPLARRLMAPALTAGAVLGWAGALRWRDPHTTGSWGSCILLETTGLPCPVCGGLRAVNDLTHGDVAAAAGSNVLVLVGLPVLLGWLALWARRATTVPAESGWRVVPLPPGRVAVVAALAVAAFGVLRWFPFAAALAP